MRRTTLILSAALIVSVALNLLAAGIMFGHRFGAGGNDRRESVGMMDRSLWAVPRELRGDVRERLRDERPAIKERVQSMREARRAANEALRARPLDRDAAEAALSRLRAEVQSLQAAFHAVALDVMLEAQAAGTLPPPEERRSGPGREDRR